MTEDINAGREEINYEIQTEIPVVPEDWAYPKVSQQTIVLANGTEIVGGVSKSSFSDRIWVFIRENGYDYGSLAILFGNTENTSSIRFNISSSERVEYVGYTRLANITAETDGNYSVCLSKPV